MFKNGIYFVTLLTFQCLYLVSILNITSEEKSKNSLKIKSHEGMTHINMSQSAKYYFCARSYDPFPSGYHVHNCIHVVELVCLTLLFVLQASRCM